MRSILFGNKTISVRFLEWLVVKNAPPIYVFGHPKKTACLDWQESLKDVCDKHGIPFSEANVNSQVSLVENLNPDVIFSVQYGPILKDPILGIPHKKCINIHFGDLPKYAGCGPVYHAIRNGEKSISVTLHYMETGIDSGDIIAKGRVPVCSDAVAGDVFEQVTSKGVEVLQEYYPRIEDGDIDSRPQEKFGKLYYTVTSLDVDSESVIYWRESVQAIHNRMRAFTFDARHWCPVTTLNGKTIRIKGSHIEGRDCTIRKYGQIVDADDNGMYVTASDGVLFIAKINDLEAAAYIEKKGVEIRAVLGD